ncbi:MAG: hypothetical protein KDB07_11300 [Planctomycetes bacterium]|nr:hypothetical protein [Planctomycetota bacterium]
MTRICSVLLLLVMASSLIAKELPEVANTVFFLQEEFIEGDEDKRVPLHLTYRVGLLDDAKDQPASMALLAAMVFETAGKRGSANWEAELKALDRLDELEAEVAKLKALEKRSDAQAKRLKVAEIELADQRIGTDFLGVGPSLNDSYYEAGSGSVSFEIGPDWFTISLSLPRKALPLFFEIEGERRNAVPLRHYRTRVELAADKALYAIRTPGIDRASLTGRYLRAAGPYAALVKAQYDYDTLAKTSRQDLLALWKATMAKAEVAVGIGVDTLTPSELQAAKKLAPEGKSSFQRQAQAANPWPLEEVHMEGDAASERWFALRGAAAPRFESARRLDAWLEMHFDREAKGLSHSVQWLPGETLVGLKLKREDLAKLSIDDQRFELQSALEGMLIALAKADLWEIEMKNAQRSLSEQCRYERVTIAMVVTAADIAKAMQESKGCELCWRPSDAEAEPDQDKARAKALDELIKGVKDEKRLAELKRLLEKTKQGRAE